MRSLLFLAWRNLVHHRFRSIVLIAVLSIVASIPLLTNLVVSGAEKQLTQRAVSTPLIYGAIGSEVELVLGAAYFNGRSAGAIELNEYDAMLDLRSYDLLPVRLNNTVRGFPLRSEEHTSELQSP